MRGMRAVIYDRTCREIGGAVGLSAIWSAGASLFRTAGRHDACLGVDSWPQALGWLTSLPEPLAEVQFWGHGTWGAAKVGEQRLDVSCLDYGHPLHDELSKLRARFIPDGLFWFRTCQSFGGPQGHEFASRFGRFLGVRVAGHTGVIAWAHSGLHCLSPGEAPTWSEDEGMKSDGSPRWSQLHHPRTIPFWQQRLPDWAERT